MMENPPSVVHFTHPYFMGFEPEVKVTQKMIRALTLKGSEKFDNSLYFKTLGTV